MIRHAFVLIIFALVGALFIPSMAIPRLGLSAHTIGILSGVLLLSVGAIWPCFNLGLGQANLLKWSWVCSSYANWLACVCGAFLGTGRLTPIASEGLEGLAAAEILVSGLLVTVVIFSLLACALSLWGLRSPS